MLRLSPFSELETLADAFTLVLQVPAFTSSERIPVEVNRQA